MNEICTHSFCIRTGRIFGLRRKQVHDHGGSRTESKFIQGFSGADNSLPDPTEKIIERSPIFPPTRRSLLPRRPGWTDNLLN